MAEERAAGGAVARRPVVVVVAQASPAHGGIATFARLLTEDAELARAFDVRLLNTTRVAVRRGGEASVRNAWHALVDAVRVHRAARSAEVVHIQTALLPTLPLLRAWLLCRAARVGGTAVLCHVHTGLANDGPGERFEPSRLERWLLRGFGSANAMLTVSDAGTRGLQRFVPANTPVERVDNAVDVASFHLASPSTSPATILFVGTIARRKGLLDLLDSIAELQRRGIDGWRLEVAGSGSEAGAEEARVIGDAFRAAGLGDALVGPIAGAALLERLARASIFVLPSHTEGQPIGILEAMAAGLPVVATRTGGIPDVVRDGVDGFVVPVASPGELADRLERLVRSPDLRERMGAAARVRAAERYDLSRLRASMAAWYARVAGERADRRRRGRG